jgi:hypothetical protein
VRFLPKLFGSGAIGIDPYVTVFRGRRFGIIFGVNMRKGFLQGDVEKGFGLRRVLKGKCKVWKFEFAKRVRWWVVEER